MTISIDDTGPPYPPPPRAGSNAIGTLTIGVSPIGDIPPFNIWDTIISQYANSSILTQIILNWDSYLDQTENFDNLYDFIWNVATARGYGLDVWGRIVGVNRLLRISVGDWFGFAEALPGSEPFEQGSFYSGESVIETYALTDQAYRTLIYAKAAANITSGSIKAINRILMGLFPNRGNTYVKEGQDIGPFFGFAEATDCLGFNQAQFYFEVLGTFFGFEESTNCVGFNQEPFYDGTEILPLTVIMTMTYVFEFPLTSVEFAIVQNSGVLPKSTGVKSFISIIP